MQDEDLSTSSHEEATKLYEQWQTEEEEIKIMEVDMEIGANFLDENIFNVSTCCNSPVGVIEELAIVGLEDECENFFLPSDDDASSNPLEFNEHYRATLRKLSESMKRSHETRKSLMMKTPKTEKYERSTSVSGVITSIEKSSEQLQAYLCDIRAVSQ